MDVLAILYIHMYENMASMQKADIIEPMSYINYMWSQTTHTVIPEDLLHWIHDIRKNHKSAHLADCDKICD